MSAPILTAEELAAIEARVAYDGPGIAPGVCVYCRGLILELQACPARTDDPEGRLCYGASALDEARHDRTRLLAALAHMTKVAEAERALRVAVQAWISHGCAIPCAEADPQMRQAFDKLRALGVAP